LFSKFLGGLQPCSPAALMEKPQLILWPMYNPVVATGYRDKDSILVPLNQHTKSYPWLEKQ